MSIPKWRNGKGKDQSQQSGTHNESSVFCILEQHIFKEVYHEKAYAY